MEHSAVAAYYDYTTPFYKFFWHKGTNGIHYGLWKKDTKNLFEAILEMNRTLADMAGIGLGTKVLDAGCGVGGSAVWLAKNRGAEVTGITLSQVQKRTAEQNAIRDGVSEKTSFSIQDYLHTSFPDNTFDVVWGLESICYAHNKKDFLKEAYRVLKPGGRVIVADGFLKQNPQGEHEQFVYRTFLKGFILDNLALLSAFERSMREVGFQKVHCTDVNEQIQKTSSAMKELAQRWYGFIKIVRMLRLVPQLLVEHTETGLVQKEFFQTTGTYAIFTGKK